MFKSVFIKYMVAFLTILTLSFVILTLIVSALIVSHSIEEKQESMSNTAQIVGKITQMRFNSSNYGRLDKFVDSQKEAIQVELAEYTKFAPDSFIFIADVNGQILISTKDSDFLEYQVPAHIIEAVIADKDISRFQTLGKVFKDRHLVYPTQIVIGKNIQSVVGVLFVCSTSSTIDSFVKKTINTIIMSCLWVFLATIFIVYFLTEKIISPIRTMTKAAKSFGTGHFDVRVPSEGNDEISELAKTFNNMAASLAKNEEMNRTFVANVSHDLRTPMTTIGGFINSILDGTIPKERQEYYLEIIASEIKRLSRLVTSMFDITRIQAGERQFTKTNFDICEVARRVLISFESKIDDKKIEIEFECDNDNMYVFADVDGIHQTLQNLMENAIKFTPEKGFIRIKITEKDQKIQASVYNTGEGIIKEDIPHIFDRFYKSDRSRGLDKSGVGLGLFIVKTIIDAHGEKIWINSVYEEYCEFLFTLQKIHETNLK